MNTSLKGYDLPNILNKSNILSVLVALIAVAIVIFTSYWRATGQLASQETLQQLVNISKLDSNVYKKYWAYGRNIESGYLKIVFMVLDKLGYKNDPNSTDWDLLWAHDYPFRTLYSKLNHLRPHQKVNKLPGTGYITNKVDLATSGLKYIPSAFRLPKDKDKLLEYAEKNPNIEFVQKNNDHRHISIKKISDIDFNMTGTFIQEYVSKPFLVDDHKFDIGIYTIITSIDPLRVYIYNGDALLRFCPVKYHPFDSSNIDKYVVGDDYLPTWDISALKYFYNVLGFGMKESLNAYIRTKGKNPAIIWNQIEDSIRIVTLAKEQDIINIINKFPSKRNFFEMMRFDFVISEDLTVHLMEANMSPNLSAAHFPLNRLLFEQVIFNVFGLVGIGPAINEQMNVADKNLMVFPTECSSLMCRSSCISPICQVCRPCISKETKYTLVQAYLEHINKGICKRIFPPSFIQKEINIDEDLEYYSSENQLQYRWFQGKCLLDLSWCN